MSTTDQKIQQYKDAYYKYYGEVPYIRKNGAWLNINASSRSFRSSDLPVMTLHLVEKAINKKMANEEKEYYSVDPKKENTVKEKKPKYFEPKAWNKIPKHVFKLFLDTIYERCNNSLYEMEKFMHEFSCEECDIVCDPNNCSELNDIQNELFKIQDELESQLHSIERKNKDIKRLKNNEIVLKAMIEKLENQYNELKKNSVLFSMEDLELEPDNYRFDDDEIPF